MKEIKDFYVSPIGRKTLKVMPLVTQEVLAKSNARMQALTERIGVAVTKTLKEHGLN
jgi:hypothetical protein